MKKLISLIFCLLLLPVLAVQAEESLIQDLAGLLTSQETSALDAKASQLNETYGLDVVILTTNYIGSRTPEAFADDLFDANYGENGVLFLLDIGSRSWHISTVGTAVALLPDDDLVFIEDMVVTWFSDGCYYEGFDTFLSILPDLLEPEEETGIGTFFLIAAVPGTIIAGIALAIMAGLMNTKKPRHSAADYTVKNSYHLRTHQDLFLYSNVTKRAKPKETKSSGSTTHRSSSGRTHGGRGGKF